MRAQLQQAQGFWSAPLPSGPPAPAQRAAGTVQEEDGPQAPRSKRQARARSVHAATPAPRVPNPAATDIIPAPAARHPAQRGLAPRLSAS